MKKETILKVSGGISALLPLLVFAQIQYPSTTTPAIINGVAKILGIIASLVGLVFILLGVFKFATARGDPKAIDEAKTDLFWGGLGIVIALILFNVPTILSWFGISWATA
jgi:protein-S-isoprenylcysteine O-methyltransferase Ste14